MMVSYRPRLPHATTACLLCLVVGAAASLLAADARITSARITSPNVVAPDEPVRVSVELFTEEQIGLALLEMFAQENVPLLLTTKDRHVTIVYEIILRRRADPTLLNRAASWLFDMDNTIGDPWRFERALSGTPRRGWVLSDQTGAIRETRSDAEAKQHMLRLQDVPLGRLPAGSGEYYIQVRATRATRLWGAPFETPWVSSTPVKITVDARLAAERRAGEAAGGRTAAGRGASSTRREATTRTAPPRSRLRLSATSLELRLQSQNLPARGSIRVFNDSDEVLVLNVSVEGESFFIDGSSMSHPIPLSQYSWQIAPKGSEDIWFLWNPQDGTPQETGTATFTSGNWTGDWPPTSATLRGIGAPASVLSRSDRPNPTRGTGSPVSSPKPDSPRSGVASVSEGTLSSHMKAEISRIDVRSGSATDCDRREACVLIDVHYSLSQPRQWIDEGSRLFLAWVTPELPNRFLRLVATFGLEKRRDFDYFDVTVNDDVGLRSVGGPLRKGALSAMDRQWQEDVKWWQLTSGGDGRGDGRVTFRHRHGCAEFARLQFSVSLYRGIRYQPIGPLGVMVPDIALPDGTEVPAARFPETGLLSLKCKGD